MDKIWKKIGGLVVAAVMTITLTNKAKAESDEATVPENVPYAVVGSAEEASDVPGEAAGPAEGETETEAAEEETKTEAAEVETGTEAAEEETGTETAEEETGTEIEEEETETEAGEEETETETAEEETESEAAEEETESEAAEEETETETAEEETESEAAEEETGTETGEEEAETGTEEEAAEADKTAKDDDFEAPMLRSAAPADPSSDQWESLGDAAFASDGEAGSDEWESLGDAAFVSDSESGTKELVLVGNTGKQNVTSDEDLIIKTAGLQHIGTLYSDGDVYIVGTGILLVDEVDLLYGKNIFLQPYEEIYGKNGGTAALFVLTGEENGVKTYELINGTYADEEGTHLIPAVLDEEYEIPEGTRLVVPSGGDLVMQCINMAVESLTDANGKTETVITYSLTGTPERHFDVPKDTEGYQWGLISTAPVLTISDGSCLEVCTGASVRLNSLPKAGIEMFTNSPKIAVNGALALSGSIIGGTMVINSTGDVAGGGTIEGADEVVVNDRDVPVTEIRMEDGTLLMWDGAYIDSLNATGYVEMISRGNWTVNTLTVNDGTLYSYDSRLDEAHTFTVKKTVSGNGTVELPAGNLLLAEGSDSCSAIIATGNHLGYAYSADEGILRFNSGTGSLEKAPLIPLTGTVSVTDNSISIPVADAEIVNCELAQGRGSRTDYSNLAAAVDSEGNPVAYVCASGTSLTYQMIDRALGGGEGSYDYLAEICADGRYSYEMLNSKSNNAVPANGVVQIIRATVTSVSGVDGGSTVTNTDTSYTGSGVLGGSGAGSVNGGTTRLALTGSRGAPGPQEDDPKPDDPKPDDPKPDDPDPDDPKPDDPDPDDPKPDDPDPDDPEKPTGDEFRVWTESGRKSGCFVLHIETRLKSVNRIAAPVKVRMAYVPDQGTEGKPFYAVFRNGDDTLTAYAASYDPVTKTITFSADMAGEFVIVAFDFEGDPLSEQFYLALEALDAVKVLIS